MMRTLSGDRGARWVALVACLGMAPRLRADVFVLRTGGIVRGTWLNPEQISLNRYAIQTESGGLVHLRASQVAEHLREPAELAEYERRAPCCPDTSAAQWELAEWCRKRGLKREERRHLERVVELDPQHTSAWQALGYSEINGRWLRPKDFYEERGYVYSRGRWRTPQEVALYEEQQRVERLEREWIARLKTWRELLGTERDAEAARSIRGIRDPHAVRALGEHLRRERSARVRLLYLAALAQIGESGALRLVAGSALNDPDPEVFHACVDWLAKVPSPALSKGLVETLQDSSNMRVNRAAYILGRLGDRRAIPALVESLWTTHRMVIPGSGRTTATLVTPVNPAPSTAASAAAPLQPTGFTSGGGPRVLSQQTANQGVLQALVSLSGGESFGFDQRAWRNWWSSVQRGQGSQSLREN